MKKIVLPVLDALTKRVKATFGDQPLKGFLVVYVHHALYTSVNVIESVLELGVKPSDMFVLGKHYSECEEVVQCIKDLGVSYQPCSRQHTLGCFAECFTRDVQSLWGRVTDYLSRRNDIRGVLIADHGGYALSNVPDVVLKKYPCVGLEKTTGGLINFERWGLPRFPVVNMAGCAAKRVLESPLIAEAVAKSVTPILPLNSHDVVYGVVGYGAIGKAVSRKLLSQSRQVVIHEKDFARVLSGVDTSLGSVDIVEDISALISASDYILGCTGRDSIEGVEFDCIKNQKVFVSCSSGDCEFNSLLGLIQKHMTKLDAEKDWSREDVEYATKSGGSICVLKGGFPVNFDHSGESVLSNDIQLTRCLALAGILQCGDMLRSGADMLHRPGLYPLSSELQNFIATKWLKYQPHARFSSNSLLNFTDSAWISEESGETCLHE